MPYYSRRMRGFPLTPPSMLTFVISGVLALLAVLAMYGHLTLLKGVSSFLLLLIAYIILLVGNLFRGL
jgi:hypothetical protein